MHRGTDRILTTHTGRLIRTPEIIEFVKARTLRQPVDRAAADAALRAGVREVVRRQVTSPAIAIARPPAFLIVAAAWSS